MSATNDVLQHSYNPYARREDAPLPPIPSSTPLNGQQHYPYEDGVRSPVFHNSNSPFSDNTYPTQPKASQQQPYGAANDYYTSPQSPRPYSHEQSFSPEGTKYHGYQPDPFDDRNAIPLQHQKPGANVGYGEEEVGLAGAPPYDRRDSRPRRQPSRRQKKGWFAKPIPYVVYTLTLIQIIIFIAEIIRNGVLTKSPIAIKPQFNPMIGPSPYVLINMGARYVPCMKNVRKITNSNDTLTFPCPSTTDNNPKCQLSELCGFSGVPNPHRFGSMDDRPMPNQWFRFIVPIFLHAGLIHIGFNMLLQMTMGKEMEQLVGSVRFFLVYFSAGIFGFVFGGNFAASGIASTGASGAIFGILALTLLDLLYHWKERRSPGKELIFILMDVVIAFVLGLLPGLDNFSHIGGFLMGLVLGICILRSPAALQQRTGEAEPPYSAVASGAVPAPADDTTGIQKFAKQPVGFFKGRKPLWWVWWLIRAGALAMILSVFIVLITRFYNVHAAECSWCKYLSCLPVNGWCDLGNLKFIPGNDTNTNGNNTKRAVDLSPWKRDVLSGSGPFFYTGY